MKNICIELTCAWFQITKSKSRVNFLQFLQAQHSDHQINVHADTDEPEETLAGLLDCLDGGLLVGDPLHHPTEEDEAMLVFEHAHP